MSNTLQSLIAKISFTFIFFSLLLWNLSASFALVPVLDEGDTPAPTNTQPASLDSVTPTVPPTTTPPDTVESSGTETKPVPLPAIFVSGAYQPDELVVRFKVSTQEKRIDECLQGSDAQIKSRLEELKALVLTTIPGQLASTYQHVLNCADVLYVEPNFLLEAANTIPNDPDWGLQYGLVNIRAPQGWDLSTGSAAVTIAIVDTGVDFGHADLASKLVAGYDFVNNDSNPQDDNGHGTHVAGIAAASSNNGTGVAGVSWGARLMPVKVLDFAGRGTYSATADGVLWAMNHGAQVVNLSLGGSFPGSVLEDAINYAHSQGVLVVAASGNGSNNFVLYPARYPNVIAVASSDGMNHWSGSNYGPEIDLAAPGSLIYSTVIGGYDTKSGSSMATGFVSGLAGILMGIPGNSAPDLVEQQMESTALDIDFPGWDDYTGAGLIQMDAAIQLAVSSVTPFASPVNTSTGGASGPIQFVTSNAPTPTWSLSPSPVTSTETIVFPSGSPATTTVSATVTVTATGSENEVLVQDGARRSNYFLPCAGIVLILLGVLLLLAFRRK